MVNMFRQNWKVIGTFLMFAFCMHSGEAMAESGVNASFRTNIYKLKSQQIARNFVKKSPTFVFDGISSSLFLKKTIAENCVNCWTVIFDFKCKNAGYGDRSGQPLTPSFTSHIAAITVENYDVVTAVLDDRWDMLTQQMAPIFNEDCIYKNIPGKARIISIQDTDPKSYACKNGKEVRFEFIPDAPDAPAHYLFPDWRDTEQNLTVGFGMHPSLTYIEMENIVEGGIYTSIRAEIIEGVCTPVIFSFPDFDPDSWQESCY